MFGIKQTDSKSSTWMFFNANRTNHCVIRKAEEDMAIVTEEQVRHRQQAIVEK
jgi:hypothetical protein